MNVIFIFLQLKVLFFGGLHTRIEGLRTEDVVHCTESGVNLFRRLDVQSHYTSEPILNNSFVSDRVVSSLIHI